MNPSYCIEILTRGGDVAHRAKIEQLPLRIGRAYDNDCIIDDPYVAPHHCQLEIDANGELQLRDLGSKNKLVVNKKRQNEVAPLQNQPHIRIGHTRIRIRATDFAVAPELADTTAHAWEGWPPALTGLFLLLLTIGFDNWLRDTEQAQLIDYLSNITRDTAIALAWSSLWALACRLFGGQLRWGRQVFIAATGYCLYWLLTAACSLIGFSLSWPGLVLYSDLLLPLLLTFVLYFHLRTIRDRIKIRFMLTSVLITAGLAGYILVNNERTTGNLSGGLYMSAIWPSGLRMSHDRSVADFYKEATSLKAQVDQERKDSAQLNLDDDDGDADDADADSDSATK